MRLMVRHWTDPSTSKTLPPAAPTSREVVFRVTIIKTLRDRVMDPPCPCGAITQPPPVDGSAHALRSPASTSDGSSVRLCGETQGLGSPDQGFLCPPL